MWGVAEVAAGLGFQAGQRMNVGNAELREFPVWSWK